MLLLLLLLLGLLMLLVVLITARFEKFSDREASIEFDQLPIEGGDGGDDVTSLANLTRGLATLFFVQTFGDSHRTQDDFHDLVE